MIERFNEEQLALLIEVLDKCEVTKVIQNVRPTIPPSLLVRREIGTIRKELIEAGLVRNKRYDYWTAEQTAEIVSLVQEGYSVYDLAERYGKSYSTMRNKVVKEFGKVPIINLEGEKWKESINGIIVSNMGRIRDGDRITYGSLNKRQNRYNFAGKKVHRLVAEAFVPNPENKPIVDHIDSNPTNNKASNLRWVSQEENLQNIETHKKIAERMASASRSKELNSLIKKCLLIEPNKLELIKAIADYSE